MKCLNTSATAVFVFGIVFSGTTFAATISTDDVVDSLGWTQTQINQQNADREEANRVDIGKNRTDIINMRDENLLRDDAIKSATDKADAALQGVMTNGQAIIDTNTRVDKAELTATNANNKADAKEGANKFLI